jgi:surface carbohydrate biosynthesis protein (TIGR04326 family)
MKSDEVIIIEGKIFTPLDNNQTIFDWDGQLGLDFAISIPAYIEANDNRLRKKYLDFVNDLGFEKLFKNRINDEYIVYKGYSLWWMSTIIEKNLVKSPAISDCIKMLALEELILKRTPKSIKVFSNNDALLQTISKFAKNLKIQCQVKKTKHPKSLKNYIKSFIPNYIQGIIYLLKRFQIYKSIPKRSELNWHINDNQLFIFSQFVNFELPTDKDSSIYSRYWEVLPSFLNQRGIKMNFLNHFHSSKHAKSIKEGIKLIEQINSNSSHHGEIHQFVQAFLNSKSFINIFFFFNSIHLKGYKYCHLSKIFKPKNSNVILWDFLKFDWQSSMLGTDLVEHLLFIESIENCLQKLPKQKLGLYLQENNGWERTFIKAWKKYQKAELIGVAHAVIRYWDLRYYEDASAFSSKSNVPRIPLPDYIAVNGPVAEKMLLSTGYPPTNIIQVEALRYLLSKKVNPREPALRLNNQLNILVCGDIDVASTTEMLHSLKFFQNTKHETNTELKFTFKSHPINEMELSSFGLEQVEITTKKINDVINSYDVAIVTDSTTAGVEAYIAGLEVIVFSYSKRLNFSPLRNVENVFFASNGKQLTDCLNVVSASIKSEVRELFFWNEPELPKWSQLFSKYYNYN